MHILIVDDEELQRRILGDFLSEQGYDVITAANGAAALRLVRTQHIQLVLLDHRMPDMNGDEVLAEIRRLNPAIRALMITAYGAVDTAVRVMKLGADDFLEKPVDLEDLLARIQKIEGALTVEKDYTDVSEAVAEGELPLNIIGAGHGMKECISLIRRVAPTPWAVLVMGETGTGKELMARLIHALSDRRDGPFVEVNCAAIPENLFESELFGHEKGAFTGAAAKRRGRFDQARGGTIFLDEVGELPETLQPKLLRALQEKRLSPVGADTEIDIDVRVVAATNRDLRQLVQEGAFREDLYYRLNTFEIVIPPLRERREDIPELVDFFVGRYAPPGTHFSPPALDLLVKYAWPGNVRELEHIIQRTVTLTRANPIRPADLPAEIRAVRDERADSTSKAGGGRLESCEREEIIAALKAHDGVQTRAAAALGISERALRYKMKKHRIDNPRRRP
jgi:two-component system response regulator AtoC